MQQNIQELVAPYALKAIELVGGALLAYIGWKIKAEVSKAMDQMSLSSAQLEARIVKGQTDMRQELVQRQTDMRMELVQSQTEMREDMDKKHQENRETVVGHIAEDLANFKAIGRTLERMDNNLIRIEERSR